MDCSRKKVPVLQLTATVRLFKIKSRTSVVDPDPEIILSLNKIYPKRYLMTFSWKRIKKIRFGFNTLVGSGSKNKFFEFHQVKKLPSLPFSFPFPVSDGLEFSLARVSELALLPAAAPAQKELTDTRHFAHAPRN
jgi:hypothetical protein